MNTAYVIGPPLQHSSQIIVCFLGAGEYHLRQTYVIGNPAGEHFLRPECSTWLYSLGWNVNKPLSQSNSRVVEYTRCDWLACLALFTIMFSRERCLNPPLTLFPWAPLILLDPDQWRDRDYADHRNTGKPFPTNPVTV